LFIERQVMECGRCCHHIHCGPGVG
jgi:hypothetical protein